MRTALAALALVVAAPTAADTATAAAMLRDRALKGNEAYAIVAGLTTDIGERLAATPPEAHARDWMVARMTALGLANVHVQTYAVPHWERGVETAVTVGPNPQRLILTALGASGATPAGGIDADVVQFADLDALRAAPAGSLKGKIVFIDHAMMAAQDGSSYGAFNAIRTAGPGIAASKGAAAYLHRSLATGLARLPHTGVTRWSAGVTPIAAAALSVPDAMQLARMIAGGPVRLHLVVTPKQFAPGVSGNVIGEITGSALPHEIVLVGGHLDSWDLGTGAIDDAAGVAITLGAAKVLIDAIRDGSLPPPRRTIRVVAFGDEESAGPLGGGEGSHRPPRRHRRPRRRIGLRGRPRLVAAGTARPRRRPGAGRAGAGARAARHRAVAAAGIRRHRCRGGGHGGRGHRRPRAGRHPVLRPPSQRRRHARQDRPRADDSERRGVGGAAVVGGEQRGRLPPGGEGDTMTPLSQPRRNR